MSQAQALTTKKPKHTPSGRGPGRPSSFRPEYIEMARKYTRMGVDRVGLAKQLNISQSQLHEWMNKYPEFGDAIRAQRLVADEAVASALYKRAIGYTRKVKKPVTWQGETEIIEVEEEVMPDVVAAQFWLKNRQPHLWRDRTEVTGADGQALAVSLSWMTERKVTTIDAEDIEVKAPGAITASSGEST